MQFRIKSSIFNQVLKRVVTLTGSDKDAKVLFNIKKSSLSIYYKSNLDKIDTQSYFYENVEIFDCDSDGTAEILASNLLTIKVPEFIDEHKFPNCKDILFNFNKAALNVSFIINWGKNKKPNVTKLTFALFNEETSELKNFEELFLLTQKTEIFSINPQVLAEAISLCNFIKVDATTKEAQGCLISVNKGSFTLVNTDSNSAVKYESPIEQLSDKDLTIVISNSVLNAIKIFLPEESSIFIGKFKNGLYLRTENRQLIVPSMGFNYIIESPNEFFTITAEKIATIELKPIISTATTLITKTIDPYKCLNINTKEGSLNLCCGQDKTEELPSSIFSSANININGSTLIGCLQRILSLNMFSEIYFDKELNRLTVTEDTHKLIFLIQGLS